MSAAPPAGQWVTSTAASRALGLNRAQVTRLVEAGLLPVLGRHGRARLLDPTALAALAARPRLADAGPEPGATPYALAVHLAPLASEAPGLVGVNQRAQVGWHVAHPVPDEAWTGWWNTGAEIADQAAAGSWPLLAAVSGIVVATGEITGWDPHPVTPGVVRWRVRPASETVRAHRFTDTAFHPAAGPPWQRLWARPHTMLPAAEEQHR